MLAYAIAAALGAGIGLAELVSRYRDQPWRATRSAAAALYIVLNAGASAVALTVIRTAHWHLGLRGSAAVSSAQAVVAGLGAMAVLRGTFFSIRAGDRDVAVGPAALLQVLMDAADRGVDRQQAQRRARGVAKVMARVSFERAHAVLPAFCLALMQNASADEETKLANQVKGLRDSEATDRAKSLSLGLALMNFAGPEVLKAAVAALGSEIQAVAQEAPSRARSLSRRLSGQPARSTNGDESLSVQDQPRA